MGITSVKDLIPEITKNKYARWAANLTMTQLEALLTLVGEHFVRAAKPMELAESYPGDRRKAGAYNALIDFHRLPTNWSLEKVRRIIRESLEPPRTPSPVKVVSLKTGTHHTDQEHDNGHVSMILEINGRTYNFTDYEMSPEDAQSIYDWLADKLNYIGSK